MDIGYPQGSPSPSQLRGASVGSSNAARASTVESEVAKTEGMVGEFVRAVAELAVLNDRIGEARPPSTDVPNAPPPGALLDRMRVANDFLRAVRAQLDLELSRLRTALIS